MAQIVALRSGAVFIAVSTARAMRSGLFPRWFGIASIVSAVVLLFSYSALPAVTLLMPLWVVAASGLVLALRSTRDLPAGA
jgi:hypothetical protein